MVVTANTGERVRTCRAVGVHVHHFLHKFHVVITVAAVAVAGVGLCHRTCGAFAVDRTARKKHEVSRSGEQREGGCRVAETGTGAGDDDVPYARSMNGRARSVSDERRALLPPYIRFAQTSVIDTCVIEEWKLARR